MGRDEAAGCEARAERSGRMMVDFAMSVQWRVPPSPFLPTANDLIIFGTTKLPCSTWRRFLGACLVPHIPHSHVNMHYLGSKMINGVIVT